MMNDSFIFYSSFFEAIEDADEKTQLEVFVAICKFALRGEEPKLSGWSKRIFALIRPYLGENAHENGGESNEG